MEIGEQLSVRRTHTLVKFIPYNPSNNYRLMENAGLCPKFDGTDVRCLNEQDCQILESVGMPCFPVDSRQTGVGPVNGDGDDGPASYTYIIPVAIAILIVIVIVILLYRRRSRPIKVRMTGCNFPGNRFFYRDSCFCWSNQHNLVFILKFDNLSFITCLY